MLGVSDIDQQHQALFDALHKLSRLEGGVPDEDALSLILSNLSHQIFEHFSSEERLMSDIGVPAAMLARHRVAHEQILEELAQMHIDAMQGEFLSLPEIVVKVSAWVHRHLLEFDLGLKPFIAHSARG